MSEPITPSPSVFSEPPTERKFPMSAAVIAAVAIAILIAILVGMDKKHTHGTLGNTLQPVSAYAQNLLLTDVAMSDAESMSGGKSTFIDGHIANKGSATVTGITVQAVFANDDALPPQIQTAALQIIRMREPEMDTVLVSEAPLAPGTGADFRLIFEGVNANWNLKQPELRLIAITTK